MTKRVLFYLFFVLLLVSNLQSQTVFGKYAGEFLTIGAGGRTSALGNASVAYVNDVTAGYWNPAALSNIKNFQLALMHEEHFGNLANYNYAAIALPYSKDLTFSLSLVRLSIDGIPDTRKALYDRNGDGKIDIGTDGLDYSQITEFSNSDWGVFLSFSKEVNPQFSWGASVKLIRRDIAEFNAMGIGFDLGAIYRINEKLTLGASLKDFTTSLVSWSTGRNELITPTLKIGAAYKIDLLDGTLMPVLDLDVMFENRKFASYFNLGPVSFDVLTGLEYSYKDIFAIRGGYNNVKQLTFGAGVNLLGFVVDYSFSRFSSNSASSLDDTHRISLLFNIIIPEYSRN